MSRQTPWLLGIHASPPTWLKVSLAVLPFAIVVAAYLIASDIRQRANPRDKLLPPPAKMMTAMKKMAFEEDKRSGHYLLWTDTLSSLRRIGLGIGLSAAVGLFLGLNMGLVLWVRELNLPFVTAMANIPPLAILPILLIIFGVGELAKVMLIFIGTFPLISRDMYLSVRGIPRETIVKSLTLGATGGELIYRVVLPQVLPRLLETVRLSMGAAWLFLIASEALASQDGLGYRVFLVRRYLAMDTIIPYVLWITLLALALDQLLRWCVVRGFPWYHAEQG